jgi:hypothetical protein
MMSRVPAFFKIWTWQTEGLAWTDLLLAQPFRLQPWILSSSLPRALRTVSGVMRYVMQYNAVQLLTTASVVQYSDLQSQVTWVSRIIFYNDTVRIAMQFVFYDRELLSHVVWYYTVTDCFECKCSTHRLMWIQSSVMFYSPRLLWVPCIMFYSQIAVSVM